MCDSKCCAVASCLKLQGPDPFGETVRWGPIQHEVEKSDNCTPEVELLSHSELSAVTNRVDVAMLRAPKGSRTLRAGAPASIRE